MTGTISFRHRLWLGIAICHLVLVTLGAASFDFERLGRLESPVHFYNEMSGSGNGYSFFAPGIENQLRAVFEVTDRNGTTQIVPLETGLSKEADLRVGNIIDQFAPQDDFGDDVTSTQVQRSLSASLARLMFARDRNVKHVTVRLENYRPVSMAEYRGGKRPEWQLIYSAGFSLPTRQVSR
jgi:hypothetical protein